MASEDLAHLGDQIGFLNRDLGGTGFLPFLVVLDGGRGLGPLDRSFSVTCGARHALVRALDNDEGEPRGRRISAGANFFPDGRGRARRGCSRVAQRLHERLVVGDAVLIHDGTTTGPASAAGARLDEAASAACRRETPMEKPVAGTFSPVKRATRSS